MWTSGKTTASLAKVAARVRLVKVVEEEVSQGRSQDWSWLQVARGEEGSHLGGREEEEEEKRRRRKGG